MSEDKKEKHKAKLAKLGSIMHKEHTDRTYGSIVIKMEAGQIVAVSVNRNIKLDT